MEASCSAVAPAQHHLATLILQHAEKGGCLEPQLFDAGENHGLPGGKTDP